jgi:glycosyltransferase involved in cell wall biosynthesis
MSRPIVYDLTHLCHRLRFESPVGIDRVDLAFGRHFARGKIAAAVHYARRYPKVLPPSDLDHIVHRVEQRWREFSPIEIDSKFLQTRDWIRGALRSKTGIPPSTVKPPKPWILTKITPNIRDMRWLSENRRVPDNAVYLNLAQHATEWGGAFEWLIARKDVQCVFFLHDLLPLDYPEFWWAGHEALFSKRVDTILRHATALITASNVVRDRAYRELKARGKPAVPILSCALPSPIETIDASSSATDPSLAECPYFVVLGTIEPRKNHSLLLNVWRSLAARGGAVPKLVVVGTRGWENEQVVNMLERCPSISEHVWEVAGLSNAGIIRLLANARGLLMPSFAEGYGLPLVEALSLGTPVVASDIPVFHEVTQETASFCDSIDGLGWSRWISALSDLQTPEARAARKAVKTFRTPSNKRYFSAVEDFLGSL